MEIKNLKYYIMTVTGFVILAVNTVGYIFDGGIKSPALTILGLVFVAIGMQTVRKNTAK